jgi:hypothetical protein
MIHQIELPVKLDPAMIIAYLGLDNTSDKVTAMVSELVDMVLAVARPVAIYREATVRGIDGDTVDIDGTVFTSRVLRKNLANQKTVYPFIATAGAELDELAAPAGNLLGKFSLDIIKTITLVNGIEYLVDYIKDEYSLGATTLMNPGSIKDWPLTEQKPLFALFNGAERQIGVTLSESGIMRPLKSRSAIIFPNDTGFVSCRLCMLYECPGRRAPYDPELEKQFME